MSEVFLLAVVLGLATFVSVLFIYLLADAVRDEWRHRQRRHARTHRHTPPRRPQTGVGMPIPIWQRLEHPAPVLVAVGASDGHTGETDAVSAEIDSWPRPWEYDTGQWPALKW